MRIAITGRGGFIGSALVKKLSGGNEIYSYPRKDLDVIFHFGSPSSNIIFDENIDYCFSETINSFLSLIKFCRDNKIKLIYPSSATVYNKNTPYALCKSILEQIQMAYGGNVLGLRIFAGYGEGERNKGDYASVVYQFCQEMASGRRPVIYGDGEQSRDFIYIDDIVDTIVDNLSRIGIMDIGTGISTTFNNVVKTINLELGTDIVPKYVKTPASYVRETICHNPCKWKVSLAEGVSRICGSWV